jgi:hypothetical protein
LTIQYCRLARLSLPGSSRRGRRPKPRGGAVRQMLASLRSPRSPGSQAAPS